MRFILVGASHSVAILEAAEASGIPVRFFHIKKAISRSTAGPVLSPKLRSSLDNCSDTIFSSIGGNAHNNFGLIEHSKPFDFIHPDFPALRRPGASGFEWIPYSAIKDRMKKAVGLWLDSLRILAELYPGRVKHLESPPQIEDETFIRNHLHARRLRYLGNKPYQISDHHLRYKLWRLNSDIFAESCRECGIEFIPVPPESMDGNGFLRPDFWSNPTHANAAYGALVIKQMVDAQ